MARELHKLSAMKVAKLNKPGRHSDGGGLYLSIDGSRRRWVFLYRDRRSKKTREMGLGSCNDVSLAKARERAAAARTALADGIDPIAAASAARVVVPTFGEMALTYLETMERQWRSEVHRSQWRMTLTEYAKPIWNKPVDVIVVEDVLNVLTPIWERLPETAGRLRGRVERVLNAAKAQGFRSGENPAAWRGHLENLLPARPKLSRGHHAALPWPQVPAFMSSLRSRTGVAPLALEFTILTAARSGETRGATWDEFNLSDRVWTIPAQRMKAGRKHRVPLVGRAVEILSAMQQLQSGPLVFPGNKQGKPLSDMTLSAVLRRMKLDNVTVHGFRSSFKDWANETTSFANELSEAALAHVTGDKTELAYRRGDALARRRQLMEAWASFCAEHDAPDGLGDSQATC